MPTAETIETMKAVRRHDHKLRELPRGRTGTEAPDPIGRGSPRQSTWLAGAQQIVALPLARAS
jgi:hypothetical protein